MGACLDCFKGGNDYHQQTPDPEERRRVQAEAAERRLQEQESRGIKNPERVKAQQKKRDELERLENENRYQGNQGGLRWQVDK